MQKFVLFFPLLFAACYCYKAQTANFCKDLPAGQYCTNNLNGFYSCNGRNSRGILYKCRGSNKCSCHLSKKLIVPIREICRARQRPLAFAKNYMIAGPGIETVTAVDGSVKTQILHSQVIRNSVTGKFRRERWTGSTNNPNTYWFQYFFLQQNGKYLKVSYISCVHLTFLFLLLNCSEVSSK